jgi:cell division protein ZapA
MPSVEILINNRTYAIACDAGEEDRLRHLGSIINQRASQLGAAASETQRLLMVSLMLADELEEAQIKAVKAANGAPAETDEERDLLIAAVEHLSERIDHIAASLSQA